MLKAVVKRSLADAACESSIGETPFATADHIFRLDIYFRNVDRAFCSLTFSTFRLVDAGNGAFGIRIVPPSRLGTPATMWMTASF